MLELSHRLPTLPYLEEKVSDLFFSVHFKQGWEIDFVGNELNKFNNCEVEN